MTGASEREALAHAEFLRQMAERQRMDHDAPSVAQRLDEVADLLDRNPVARTVETVEDWRDLPDGSTVRVGESDGTQVAADLYVDESGRRHWFTTLENRGDGDGYSDEWMHGMYGPATVLAPVAAEPSEAQVETAARGIAAEYDRRGSLKPGSWWKAERRRELVRQEARAALEAANEVRDA